MGWIRRALLLSGLVGLGLLALTQPQVMRAATERALPGQEVHDLGALDPDFRSCFEALLADLRAEGWRPVVRATWRDEQRQAFYRAEGSSQTLRSHHRREVAGRPAALAADVALGVPLALVPLQARFFRAMREAAPERGLVTGGSWSRSSRLWAPFDLGWDPAHVEAEAGRCGR